MHRAYSLTHARDSLSGSDYYCINGSIIRRPNDSALETCRLGVDIEDSGGTCFYLLLVGSLCSSYTTFLCLGFFICKKEITS